jgi:hypothetical protein
MYFYNLHKNHTEIPHQKTFILSGLHPKHETVFVLSIFIVVDDGGGPEVQSPWHIMAYRDV